MSRPTLLFTIDTEGDALWSRPRKVSTHNARYLPRLAHLCAEFGVRPTWLVSQEMALDPHFLAWGRGQLRSHQAEIGLHLHAWNTPPLHALQGADRRSQPYLLEYPPEAMRAKLAQLHQLLQDRFETRVRSHRAGRWALNGCYAQALIDQGLEVDCSVTPHVDWRDAWGATRGGVDYRHFPTQPYGMHPLAIDQARPNSPLLEVPVTVRPSPLGRLWPQAYQWRGLRRWAWRWAPPLLWLYPGYTSGSGLRRLLRQGLAEGWPCLQLVLHSSDLMPGGSPWVKNHAELERLYADLRGFLQEARDQVQGQTLSEFRDHWGRQRGTSETLSATLSTPLSTPPSGPYTPTVLTPAGAPRVAPSPQAAFDRTSPAVSA